MGRRSLPWSNERGAGMSDFTALYVFIFLMVSNLTLSILYAVGTRQLKAAARKALQEARKP